MWAVSLCSISLSVYDVFLLNCYLFMMYYNINDFFPPSEPINISPPEPGPMNLGMDPRILIRQHRPRPDYIWVFFFWLKILYGEVQVMV